MSCKINRTLTLGEQFGSIRSMFPQFKATLHRAYLQVDGESQPTARSEVYKFRLKYHLFEQPEITIVSHKLCPNFNGEPVPHVYPGLKLCLYKPGYREFTRDKYLGKTIVGWISTWLYYYEIWHITGEWKGGGEHPELRTGKKKQ